MVTPDRNLPNAKRTSHTERLMHSPATPPYASAWPTRHAEQVGDDREDNVLDRSPVPVLLVSMEIGRYRRKLIEGEIYGLLVLFYQELTPEITIQPLGCIDL